MVKTNMAQTQQPTKQQPTNATAPANASGGRPAKPEATTPEARAVVNLQYALDRACSFIADGTASYARRAKTAARAGVPKEKVLRGLSAGIEAAVADARAAIERAYLEPTKPDAPKSRVTLA